MRPIVLTLTGAAIGLAAALPATRALVQATPDGRATVTVAPAVDPPRPSGGPVGLARPGPPPAGSARPPRTAPRPASVTVTGPAVSTRYGPVQVRVVVTAGRLVSATAVRLPDRDGESRQINSWAGPALSREAVTTQGRVDTVSGATWTSGGYRRSLQAALDAARTAASTAAYPGASTAPGA